VIAGYKNNSNICETCTLHTCWKIQVFIYHFNNHKL